MDTLRHCYDKLEAIIGDTIEPYAVVETVEAYRQYFKPRKVNVILLAESHVYTTAAEHAIQVQSPFLNLPSCPSNFARFVYCLGYGENSLLQNPIRNNSSGTWQYWKLFVSCQTPVRNDIDTPFNPVLKGSTILPERIASKCQLLGRLQEMGIWLVDASIMGIDGARGKSKPKVYDEILRCSWDNHVKSIVETASPKYVICIGKGVWNVLQHDVQSMMRGNCCAVSQPQSRTNDPMMRHQVCYKICKEYC